MNDEPYICEYCGADIPPDYDEEDYESLDGKTICPECQADWKDG